MKKVLSIAAFAALLSANAQITTTGPFTGQQSEGWETQTAGQFAMSYSCFGGGGNEIRSLPLGSSGAHITSGWSFFGVTYPHGGTRFFGGAGNNAGYFFATPVTRFGGYFCTNADAPDATAIFYDTSGNVITSMPVSAPLNGQWAWNGWQSTVPISRIDIIASNQYGGFIDMDDMEADFASATITINPTTTSLNPGIVVSGTPQDLYTSNDMYYVLRPGIVLSSAQSPIVLTMSGNGPGNTPSDLKIVVESHANQGNLRQTIEVYNFNTAAYEIVDQQTLPTTDVVRNITISNPANHVGPANEVRARLSYKATGPVLNYPWLISIDEATWRYTP